VTPPVAATFLEGARVVAGALADDAVASAWDAPSVLEGQAVSGLAGHLARGGVWVVGEYLDGGEPTGPVDFETAGQYFATLVTDLPEDGHVAIRDRGAAIAAAGRAELVTTLDERLAALELRLADLSPERLVAVASGKVMRLEDYLVTRIVEQTVHLDDLARSVGRAGPWGLPPEAEDLTIRVGTDIGRRHDGAAAMIRALYREGFAEGTLPVL
jgi:hypothetical protein